MDVRIIFTAGVGEFAVQIELRLYPCLLQAFKVPRAVDAQALLICFQSNDVALGIASYSKTILSLSFII